MIRVLSLAAALVCFGALTQNAGAGGPAPTFALDFQPTSVLIELGEGTTVTASLTATIGNPLGGPTGTMFIAGFSTNDGFTSVPGPITLTSLSSCSQLGMAFTCTIPILNFFSPDIGPATLTANGSLTQTGSTTPYMTAADTFGVPEPATLALLSLSLLGLGIARRKQVR